MGKALTVGEVAAAAGLPVGTLHAWTRRMPDELNNLLYGQTSKPSEPSAPRPGRTRQRAWRRFGHRDALVLSLLVTLTQYGIGPDTGRRWLENLVDQLSNDVWPAGDEKPDLSCQPMLVLEQIPNSVPNSRFTAIGVPASKASRIQTSDQMVYLSIRPVNDALERVRQARYPTILVDLSLAWERVQSRLQKSSALY